MISKAKTHIVLFFLLFTWICLLSLALASSQSFLFWHYNLYNVDLSQLKKDLGCLSNVQPGANKSLLRETRDMCSYFIVLDTLFRCTVDFSCNILLL